MPITAKFKGGPLDGRKNVLKDRDHPTKKYQCKAEARNANFDQGHYKLCKDPEPDGSFLYVWQGGGRIDVQPIAQPGGPRPGEKLVHYTGLYHGVDNQVAGGDEPLERGEQVTPRDVAMADGLATHHACFQL